MLAGMGEVLPGTGQHDHAGHGAGHGHGHGEHRAGALAGLRHVLRPHSHEAAGKVDAAMEASAEGLRALWVSLAALAVTAVLQSVVVALSGSVALLGDTLHNAAVAVAALIGFMGNELVARYRIRVGRRIGSAALVADGLHARTDGFTSLAVLLGVAGAALGWDWADPAVGLLITLAILAVLRQAAREIYRRLMDAVDPALVDQAERTLRGVPGVLDVGQVRLRWIGHQLRAECEIVISPHVTAVRAHQTAVAAEHALLHEMPRLSAAHVHAAPEPRHGTDYHATLASHR